MTPNVSTVIFAIAAGLRLYSAGKRVYVEKTLARPVPLPLPSGVKVNRVSARRWFRGETGQAVVKGNDRIAGLLKKASLDPVEERELVELYVAAFLEFETELPDEFRLAPGPSVHEVQSFIAIRQWASLEAGGKITALQRIAGTLVNLAIDYFLLTPGAVSDKRPEGRALRAFLEAIDTKDFADTPVEYLAGDLLIAIVEAVKNEPRLSGMGDTTEKIVINIATSLSESTKNHLRNLPTTRQKEGGLWLQWIAHAMVRGTAQTVLSDPEKILGLDQDEGAVIKEVGGTVAELLIGPDSNRQLQFQRLFSGQGLDTVIRSTLKAVTDNPDVLRIGNQGLKRILIEIADQIETVQAPFAKDLFPGLVRLVLEKSGSHLSLLWGGDTDDPKKNLLLFAMSEVLKQFATEPTGGRWTATLTRTQVLAVAESVFDKVVDNPHWVKKIANVGGGQDSPVGVCIGAVFASLAKLSPGRINGETVASALDAGIKAGAMELSLLVEVPGDTAGHTRTAMTMALDAIFDGVFGAGSDTRSQWRQARNSALQAAMGVVLEGFAEAVKKNGVKPSQFDAIRRHIRDWIDRDPLLFDVAMQIKATLQAA